MNIYYLGCVYLFMVLTTGIAFADRAHQQEYNHSHKEGAGLLHIQRQPARSAHPGVHILLCMLCVPEEQLNQLLAAHRGHHLG